MPWAIKTMPVAEKTANAGSSGTALVRMAIAGGLIATPLGAILSTLGLLFMFLGLFFFVLFGLVIGAVMYRVGLSARPLPRPGLLVVGMVVSLFTWSLGLFLEAYSQPRKISEKVLKETPKIPPDMTRAQALADIGQRVREHFEQRYGSAGIVGYSRWILSGEKIDMRATPESKVVTSPTPQSAWGYPLRVTLSLALVMMGVLSQVLPLHQREDPVERVETHKAVETGEPGAQPESPGAAATTHGASIHESS